MGRTPKTSHDKPQTRIVSFDDAKKATRKFDRTPQRKSIKTKAAAKEPAKVKSASRRSIKASAPVVDRSVKRDSLAARQAEKQARKDQRQARQTRLKNQMKEIRPSKSALEARRQKRAEEAEKEQSFTSAFMERGKASLEKSKAVVEQRKKDRAKAKAHKAYEKSSLAASAKSKGSQAAETAGPRAAVYKGEMGASQKKSTKMQAKEMFKAVITGSTSGIPEAITVPDVKLPDLSGFARKAIAALCVMIIFTIALYGPAQQYYLQIRENDRLKAEYTAVAERAAFLKDNLYSLSTESGIEDKAHYELGYVKEGEETATVKGINVQSKNKEFTSNVAPNSVPAPETWYSPVLDTLFGYKK